MKLTWKQKYWEIEKFKFYHIFTLFFILYNFKSTKLISQLNCNLLLFAKCYRVLSKYSFPAWLFQNCLKMNIHFTNNVKCNVKLLWESYLWFYLIFSFGKTVPWNPWFQNIDYSREQCERYNRIWKSLNAIDFAVFSGSFKDWKIMVYRTHSPSSLLNARWWKHLPSVK